MKTKNGHVNEKWEGQEYDITAKNAVIAVYATHEEAEKAIRELQRSGFDMKKLSIVGKNYEMNEEVVGYYTTGDRIKTWGTAGAFWGSIWGLMFGSAFFLVPGVGPLLAAGPLVGWIVGALEGAIVIGGLSALGAGLYSFGIPKNSIVEYERQIKAGKFVVIAHGTPNEINKTKNTLAMTKNQGIEELTLMKESMVN